MKRTWILGALFLGACSNQTIGGVAGGVGRSELTVVPRIEPAPKATLHPTEAALSYMRSSAQQLGLDGHSDFVFLRQYVSNNTGLNHQRLQQTYQGIPVWGADVVVGANDTTIQSVGGTLMRSLQGLELKPSVGADSALSLVKSDVGLDGRGPLKVRTESTTLVILPQKEGATHLAWHTEVYVVGYGGVAAAVWHHMVDAHDGSILKKWDGLTTAVVKASGKGGNPRVMREWKESLEVTQDGSNYVMNTDQYNTHAQDKSDYSGTSLMDFNKDDIGGNDAHGFAAITIRMMKEWQGFNSIDNMGFKLESITHVPNPDTGAGGYNNAFWKDGVMHYGDGDGKTFYQFTSGGEVIGHEINHGFTERHSNLTYSDQSGGGNEGFSDVAGVTTLFYWDPSKATFTIGSDLFIQPGKVFRDMCHQAKDGKSIESAKDYKAGIDVHMLSGVPNKAFCRAAKRFSGVDVETGTATVDGIKKASKAWYEANASKWTASSDYESQCQGVIDAAKDLKYTDAEISILGDSWADTDVKCTYTKVAVNEFTMTLTPMTAMGPQGGTATFQVATTVAMGSMAQSLMLSVTGLSGGVTGAFNPASVMSGANSTLTLTIPANTPVGDIKFTVSAAGSVTHTAMGTLTVMTAPPDMAQPPVPSNPDGAVPPSTHGVDMAGKPKMVTPNGGCTCDQVPGAPPTGILLFGLVAVALLLRRRDV